MGLNSTEAALQDVPGGATGLLFLISVMGLLLLVVLFTALLLGAHRRYRQLQESLRSEEREVARLRTEVDLWTEAAKRLKEEAGDEVDLDDEDADDEGDGSDPNDETGELR